MPDSCLPTITAIIPCWKDGGLVRAMAKRALGWHELVVVLAFADAALEWELENAGAKVVVAGMANRGKQLALGAEKATGEVLLFHHADSEVAAEQVVAVARAMSDERVVGGAFHRKFDARHPLFRWIEPIERRRAQRFGTLFGDQSIFVRRSRYAEMGGMRDLPLMEDVDFSRRLRRAGRIVLLDPPMATSARAHAAGGAFRTSLRNGLFLFLYHLGVSPARLHSWYYAASKSS